MVDKINVTPLGTPSDDGSFSQIQEGFENLYHSVMDSSFAALGRTIILHLPPQQSPDTSGVEASTLAVRYNPFQRTGGRQVPSTISTTRSPAVQFVHRDVSYNAHIKHGPKEADDKGGLELLEDEVQITTLIESKSHVNQAISATIDNSRYTLITTRPIGFRDKRYLISKWRRLNESENG